MHEFTPEAAIAYQEGLGADIVMPLDVCVPSDADRSTVQEAVDRTSPFGPPAAERLTPDGDQTLFGIVQGGLFPDLRRRSAEAITRLDFPGYAIGGLSVGESKEQMYEAAEVTAGLLPADRPRYLMGVGSPEDLVEGVARGIDMFDCVLPTRIARNGSLFVREGRLNVDKAPYRSREGPIEDGCDCYTCGAFSAAYLHHLFKARELLAYRLADDPQPALRPEAHGGDARRNSGRAVRGVSKWVPRCVHAAGPRDPPRPAAQVADGAEETVPIRAGRLSRRRRQGRC